MALRFARAHSTKSTRVVYSKAFKKVQTFFTPFGDIGVRRPKAAEIHFSATLVTHLLRVPQGLTTGPLSLESTKWPTSLVPSMGFTADDWLRIVSPYIRETAI